MNNCKIVDCFCKCKNKEELAMWTIRKLYEELKSGKLDKDSLTYTIEAFYEYNTKFDKEEVNENI